jgi:hypothetical protein
VYGEDGMAAEYIENLSIPLIEMDNQTMDKNYNFFNGVSDTIEKKEKVKKYVQESAVDSIEDFEGLCDKLGQEYEQIKQDREDLRKYIFINGEKDIFVPINLNRII